MGAVRGTVLIVDDHAGFRAGARALLTADGYDVVGEAADGEAALEAARRLRPEIVLLDIQLPGLDGFAVAERLAGDAVSVPRAALKRSAPLQPVRGSLCPAAAWRSFAARPSSLSSPFWPNNRRHRCR